MSDRIEDRFPRLRDFEELLDEAENNATSDAEVDFLEGLRANYKKYNVGMFLSKRQLKWLTVIAQRRYWD